MGSSKTEQERGTDFSRVIRLAGAWAAPVFILVFAMVWMVGCPVLGYYAGIRSGLFSGFLTLGSFLLSLKSFVIFNFKKELFDTKEYEERHDLYKGSSSLTKYERFSPLQRLSDLLFLAVGMSFLSAIAQITVGALARVSAVALSLALGAATLSILGRAWWAVRENLWIYFDLLRKREVNRVDNKPVESP